MLTFIDFCGLGHIWTIRVLGFVGPLAFRNLGHCEVLGLLGFGHIALWVSFRNRATIAVLVPLKFRPRLLGQMIEG